MNHQSDFTPEPDTRHAVQSVADIAAVYARLFLGSDDGKRVLANLRRFFGVGREVFEPGGDGRFDPYAAAKRDGQRDVLRHIEAALLAHPTNETRQQPKV